MQGKKGRRRSTMTRERRNSLVQDFLVPQQAANQDSEDTSNLQLQFSKRLSTMVNDIETKASGGKSRGAGKDKMKSQVALQQLFLSSENRPSRLQPDQEGEYDQDEVAISGQFGVDI
jgi:hypothetical protein